MCCEYCSFSYVFGIAMDLILQYCVPLLKVIALHVSLYPASKLAILAAGYCSLVQRAYKCLTKVVCVQPA